MIIKSSTALRNDSGTISELAHAEAEPISSTKNGEGDLVVMSIEAFEQREETLKLRARLEAAEQAGAVLLVIGRPIEEGLSVEEAEQEMRKWSRD